MESITGTCKKCGRLAVLSYTGLTLLSPTPVYMCRWKCKCGGNEQALVRTKILQTSKWEDIWDAVNK